MIDINWGNPLSFVLPDGDVKTFATLETAAYWLRRKWPVDDLPRAHAVRMLDAAAHCMIPVRTARVAFSDAARTAGFKTHRAH